MSSNDSAFDTGPRHTNLKVIDDMSDDSESQNINRQNRNTTKMMSIVHENGEGDDGSSDEDMPVRIRDVDQELSNSMVQSSMNTTELIANLRDSKSSMSDANEVSQSTDSLKRR